MIKYIVARKHQTVTLLVMLVIYLLPAALSADVMIDREFEFASGLIEIGFADYAEKVVEQILVKHPEQKSRTKLITAEILISKRKYADAQALINSFPATDPKAQAISLALANAYYRSAERDKAKVIYQDFFKTYGGRVPTDPDLKRFYQEAAYKFGQMQEKAGDLASAIKAYERVLATKPGGEAERFLMADQSALYIRMAEKSSGEERKKYLNKSSQLCSTIQWGPLDLSFGSSIVTLARIERMRGKDEASAEVLKSNMDILKEIDTFMKEEGMPMSVSPMAGARYMLGEIYEKKGDALAGNKAKRDEAIQAYGKALGEFFNVFAKYGESNWGPDAGKRAKKIKVQLEAWGKTVNIDFGKYEKNAAKSQFKLADNYYNSQSYDKAISEYIKILNEYPETEKSQLALGNLASCYAAGNDLLSVKMLTAYLSERFAGEPNAAISLLRLGKGYLDKDDADMYMLIYETFVEGFPDNKNAPGVLFSMALLRNKAGDKEAAKAYYKRIIDNYPDDKNYIKALGQIAWGHYLGKQYPEAVPSLISYVGALQPGFDKAQAQFCIADAHKQLLQYKESLAAYKKVMGWLGAKDTPYNASPEDVKKNKDLLEKSVFYLGYIYARMNEPEESVPSYRSQAVKSYAYFLKAFPKSELAPPAMSGLGALQLEAGSFDQAVETFNKLASQYPDSAEGKSANYSLIRSAMEVGKTDVAKSAFGKMIAKKAAYTPPEFNRIGQLMLDNGLNEEAMMAFRQVRSTSEERADLERALFGLGQAHYEMGNYEESIKPLEELMDRYPKSGLFYNAKFTLGSDYRATGRLKDAVDVMKDIFKFADKDDLVARANYTLGTIQVERGELDAALASFQRVALLSDASKPDVRPIVENCILDAIKVSKDLGRFKDAMDSCEQYLELFPNSPKVDDIRSLRSEIKLKASSAALEPTATAAP